MRLFQKGFNFSQDGPGNRLVYHLLGCNFRCPWCANPEGMGKGAARVFEMTPEQIAREAVSCRMMFFEGGGVTFTGGEPTLQHAELLSTLQLLREKGIGTAIETNGSDEKLDELLPFVDHLIMDLKHPDAAAHLCWTGDGGDVTRANIRAALEHRKVLIRIPLIKDVNTDPDAFCAFFDGCRMENAAVEILPYHEYGKGKWTDPYTITDGFVPDGTVARMKAVFSGHGYRLIET